jgi:hypothetical protein
MPRCLFTTQKNRIYLPPEQGKDIARYLIESGNIGVRSVPDGPAGQHICSIVVRFKEKKQAPKGQILVRCMTIL